MHAVTHTALSAGRYPRHPTRIGHGWQLITTRRLKQRILHLIGKQREAGREICVVEAALFLEERYQEFCDEVWYVYTEEEIRIQRLMESRGYSREKSLGIIRNQVSDQVFRENTDYVIGNNGDLEDTRRQIREGIERNETL